MIFITLYSTSDKVISVMRKILSLQRCPTCINCNIQTQNLVPYLNGTAKEIVDFIYTFKQQLAAKHKVHLSSNICLCTALRNCTALCNCAPKCKCCFCLSRGLYVSFFWKLALMHKDTCIGYKYKGHRTNPFFRRIGDRFGFHLKSV